MQWSITIPRTILQIYVCLQLFEEVVPRGVRKASQYEDGGWENL